MKAPTIVFADDEPALSEALRSALEARGYTCIAVTDMTQAWKLLNTRPVAVLVTDIMMPPGSDFAGLDSSVTGYNLVGMVRRSFPSVSVVCLSVIADTKKINELKTQNVLYLRKGETSLATAWKLIESRVTGKISFY